MALIKNGKKVPLGTGYGTSSIPYAEYRKQQQQERAARITERAARTLEANARRGVSASNTAGPPAASVSKATTSRGRVSLDPERGYSPGRERASRQYVSLPEPRKTETAPVDYRRAVELNRLNHDLNRLEAQRRQAAVDLDMDALNRVNAAMENIRTAQDPNRGFWKRLGNTVKGGAKGFLSNHMDTMGTLYQNGQGGRDARGAEELAAYRWEVDRAERELRELLEQDGLSVRKILDGMPQEDGLFSTKRRDYLAAAGVRNPSDVLAVVNILEDCQRKAGAIEQASGVQRQAGEAARELAAAVGQSAAQDLERAKEGKGWFQNILVDAAASTVQMAGDAAANAVLGTPQSMIPFAARAFGGGTMQARQAGANLKQQNLYGAAMAAKEVITEKLFGVALPFSKVYGGGALDDAVERAIGKAVDRFAGTDAGKKLLGGALTFSASVLSEGAEEFIGDWMEWQMPRIYGGEPVGIEETLENSLYDFLVGSTAGLIGGSTNVIGSPGSGPAYNQAGTAIAAERADGTPKYSFAERAIPTYEELIRKPDIRVVDLRGNRTGRIAEQRRDFLNSEQVKSLYAAPVVNRDTGEALFITPKTITHTFSNLGMDQVALAEHLPEIIREAVLTHGEPSRKAPDDMTTGVFTLFGAVRTDKGVQPVKLTVKEYYIAGKQLPQNVQEYLGIGILPETYASLYDGRALVLESIEKEEASSSALYTTPDVSIADKYPSASSAISVKDLLDLVKGDAAKYVPARNSLRAHTGAEVESDPLMQALFGDGIPTKPDRPLDVLEQDALRLYAADPETGGFASESRWEPGLVADDYVIQAIKSSRTGENGKPYLSEADYRRLNAVCRALGVRARFVDVIPGVSANARIAGSEILIAKDHRHPVRFVLGHELAHRIQALAPAEYRTFRDHVARDSASREAVEARIALYAKNGVELTYEGALDEITADYAGELFEGGEVLDQQLRYGTAQAAKEYITEKLFGLAVPQRLLGKAGAGSLDDAERGIRNVTERLARTPAGRKVLGGLLTWGAGGATESLEEGIGALIENTLINPNLRAWDPDTRTGQEKFEDGLHDMLVGGLSGLMGVPNLVSYHPNTAQSLSLSTLEDTGAQPGQTAPAAQTAPV